jgi:hypothetical protein
MYNYLFLSRILQIIKPRHISIPLYLLTAIHILWRRYIKRKIVYACTGIVIIKVLPSPLFASTSKSPLFS